MAENKNKILVYRDWISTFESLSNDEAGKLIKHFFRYINDLSPEAPDRLTMLLFEPIKQTLKRDLKAYQETCEKNKDNVGKRWNKENTTVYDRIESHTNYTDSDNDTDNDNEKDIILKENNILIEKEFETFWNLYDKKVGDKKKLFKKWTKLKQPEKDKIFETLPKYVASTEKKYRKNPETYLNNEAWNDEIIMDIKIKGNGNRHGSVQAGAGGRKGSSTL